MMDAGSVQSESALLFRSPHRQDHRVHSFDGSSLRFYEGELAYAPTPLVLLPGLAASLGLDLLYAKLEVARFGLTSFKILGVQWALTQYRKANPGHRIARLITATDGNHGHAVARVARNAGLSATIYVPRQTSSATLARLREDGAHLVVVPGTYDDSVDAAYMHSQREPHDTVLLSDTSADTDDCIAEWVIQGYETVFAEIDSQLSLIGPPPDLVLIQIGIGGLAAAASRYFRTRSVYRPELVGVESSVAACALHSAMAGDRIRIDASGHTVMAGINAGLLSAGAWPDIKHGFDWFLAIDDSWCQESLEALRSTRVHAGPTGVASIAGLLALASTQQDLKLRGKRAIIIITEGRAEPTL